MFFVYLFLAGPGAWSLDRWLRRDAGSASASAKASADRSRNPAYAGSPTRQPRWRAVRRAGSAEVRGAGSAQRTRLATYSLGVLRIVAGFLFIFHGTGQVAPTLDPISLWALAVVLELVGR
jgi:hypothetical protein